MDNMNTTATDAFTTPQCDYDDNATETQCLEICKMPHYIRTNCRTKFRTTVRTKSALSPN